MAPRLDQQRARDAVNAERISQGLSKKNLADVARIHVDTLSNFLRGESWGSDLTHAAIERALGWPSQTIMHIARGGDVPPPARSASVEPPSSQPGTEGDTVRDRRAKARAAMSSLSDEDFEVVFSLAERLRQPHPTLDPGREEQQTREHARAV